MKKLMPFLKPYTVCFIIGPVFKLLEAVLELFMPILMAQIIDNGGRGEAYVLRIGGYMLLTCTIGLVSALICQYTAAVAGSGVGTTLRRTVFSKTMSLSGAQIDRFGSATLFSRITNDTNQVSTAVNMFIRLIVRVPFICIGSVIATLLIDWRLGLLVLATLPLCTLFLLWYFKRTAPMFSKVQQGLDAIGRKVGENIDNIRVVRAFNSEGYEKQMFAGVNQSFTGISTRAAAMASLINPVTSLMLNFCIAGVVYLGGFAIHGGRMTSGELIAFISYVTQMTAALIVGANTATIFVRAAASLQRINALLDAPASENERPDGAAVLPEGQTAVQFRNVSFAYHAGSGYEKRLVLRNISFVLPVGGSLGVIGTTGSGKTSLVSLLLRYYTPSDGSITFMGMPIENYAADTLRGAIGYVPQRLELLSGTVFDNIDMNRNLSKDAVHLAAQTAQAEEFILKRPGGYDASVAKDGRNLSGGQKQRLTVARALAAAPRLLILDDASSALDYATDLNMRKAIRRNYPGMTTLVISQRVWGIQDCDAILVLESGTVAGLGTHTQLLRDCAAYREIVAAQQGGDDNA